MGLLVRSLLCCVLANAIRAQVVVVYPPPPVQPTQVVMIERRVPMRIESQEAYGPAVQTNYLIALKGDQVRIAEQYWVKDSTLYYLTADHQQKSVPMEKVDLALTARLNSERDIEFNLPASSKGVAARSRTVRHTASAGQKRCGCPAPSSARLSTGGASRTTPPSVTK